MKLKPRTPRLIRVIGGFFAVFLVAGYLSACENRNTGESSPAQPSQPIASAPEATHTPSRSAVELEGDALNRCKGPDIATNVSSVDYLEILQHQMTCVENFLDNYRTTDLWPQAYAIRHKSIMSSMDVIRTLNGSMTSVDDSDIAATQKTLTNRERFKKLKSENYHFVNRALQEINISLHHGLFDEMRAKGMQTVDPKDFLEAANRSSRQAGVWESTIDETSDGGQFIVTRWVTEKTPSFALGGYGMVSSYLRIEDEYFSDNGAFSNTCQVRIGIAQSHLSYPCEKYLSGVDGLTVLNEMINELQKDLVKQASENNR